MPILKVQTVQKVDAGIRQETPIGLVSEFECRDVARKCMYSWTQWLDLDVSERASCIAHVRIGLAIEHHVSEAYMRNADRKARNRR